MTLTDENGDEIDITDCAVMAADYLILCRTYGGTDGHCCASCDGKGNLVKLNSL